MDIRRSVSLILKNCKLIQMFLFHHATSLMHHLQKAQASVPTCCCVRFTSTLNIRVSLCQSHPTTRILILLLYFSNTYVLLLYLSHMVQLTSALTHDIYKGIPIQVLEYFYCVEESCISQIYNFNVKTQLLCQLYSHVSLLCTLLLSCS